MAVLLALLSSALWGTSDFLGGTASRRLPPVGVVAVSETFGMLAVLVVAGVTGAFDAPTGYVGWSVLGALSGIGGITAFYRALATGTMGVIAPIAATGVIVPVLVGIAGGDRPTTVQDVGVAVAVLGVVLASGPELRDGGRVDAGRPLLLAVVAAIGFGVFFVCMDHGAESSTVMTLLLMRVVSVAVLVGIGWLGLAPIRVGRADFPLLGLIGGLDVGANAAFAVAAQHGLLSIVSVLSSLYPAVTVLLARSVHAERLRPIQLTGVAGALAGVALIASGGAG